MKKTIFIFITLILCFFTAILKANPPAGYIMPSTRPEIALIYKLDFSEYKSGDVVNRVNICDDLEKNPIIKDKYTGLEIKLHAYDELDVQIIGKNNMLKVLRVFRRWTLDKEHPTYEEDTEITIKGNMEISDDIFCLAQELS